MKKTSFNVLAGLALAGAAIVASGRAQERTDRGLDIRRSEVRTELNQAIVDLTRPQRESALTVAGEGGSGGVYLETYSKNARQESAAARILGAFQRGVRTLLSVVQTGQARGEPVHNRHEQSLMKIDAGYPWGILHGFDVITRFYSPPQDSVYSETCNFQTWAWPSYVTGDKPAQFIAIVCPNGDKRSVKSSFGIPTERHLMDWLVFLDFPPYPGRNYNNTRQRYVMGDWNQLSGELQTQHVKSYWVAMAGFTQKNETGGVEQLSLGLSVSESAAGSLTTVYGNANFSDNPCSIHPCSPTNGGYTFQQAQNMDPLHRELIAVSRKAPKTAAQEGALQEVGAVTGDLRQ